MISYAIRLIADELETYLVASGLLAPQVLLANIADLEQESGGVTDLRDHILVSLVNIEEESALKNIMPHSYPNPVGGVSYEEPPVYINLYLLFSSTYNQGGDHYETALRRLSLVIQFFQGHRVFNVQNAPNSSVASPTQPDEISTDDKNNLRLYLELYTLTFEQINHLWGSLGGKQVPFAMYKVRLVRVRDRRVSGTGPVIEEIGRGERVLPGNGQ